MAAGSDLKRRSHIGSGCRGEDTSREVTTRLLGTDISRSSSLAALWRSSRNGPDSRGKARASMTEVGCWSSGGSELSRSLGGEELMFIQQSRQAVEIARS